MSEGRVVAEGSASAFSAPEVGASSPQSAAAGPAEDDGARLGTEVEAVIGRRLKALYDDVVNAPVPDRFMELLAKLEEAPAAAQGEPVARPPSDGKEKSR